MGEPRSAGVAGLRAAELSFHLGALACLASHALGGRPVSRIMRAPPGLIPQRSSGLVIEWK